MPKSMSNRKYHDTKTADAFTLKSRSTVKHKTRLQKNGHVLHFVTNLAQTQTLNTLVPHIMWMSLL